MPRAEAAGPVITGYDVLTCLGDAEQTFQALRAGQTGVRPLSRDAERLGVDYAYEIADDDPERRASRWLARVVAGAVRAAGLDGDADTGAPTSPAAEQPGLLTSPAPQPGSAAEPSRIAARPDSPSPAPGSTAQSASLGGAPRKVPDRRIAVIVGTGLRELPDAERWWVGGGAMELPELHFGAAVRAVLPGVTEVLTISNACAASGYALALGADLLAAGEADAVVVAGCDSVTDSLLAVIGRGSAVRSSAVRPFDADREGVLLGEGAAAVVLEPEAVVGREGRVPLARLHGVGLSCDAFHETAPDPAGIAACMRDAHVRAGVVPGDIDLVLAHGTSTALNDPAEASALTEVFGADSGRALVTGIKGAVGHTSGAAALMSLVVAVQAMHAGVVPPIWGLATPIPETAGLELVGGDAPAVRPRLAQVDSFGFGGVNAVAVVGAAR